MEAKNSGENKILIVDDDVQTLEIYVDVFQRAGYDVVSAKDGVDGLDKATKELPDIIFTGIIMPRMDGFAFMEALKKNVSTANIPVVISSHLGREEDKEKACQLGAKDFIVRDMVSPKEVVQRINKLFFQEVSLQFDPVGLDAPRVAQNLGVGGNFQCQNCQERLVLKMTSSGSRKNRFEAHFACPKCGWEAK